MKKGQVTMFIILGIVILFFFLMAINKSNLEKQKLLDFAEEEIKSIMESNTIKNYINLCIEREAKTAFTLVGLQGGYIYKSQGGIAEIDQSLIRDYIGSNIPYSLYYNQSKNSTYISPPPPMYPSHNDSGRVINSSGDLIWPGYPDSTITKTIIDNSLVKPETFIYYLGDNKLPKLCYEQGLNYEVYNTTIGATGCGPGAYSNNPSFSIQGQIESYLNNNISVCTDFERFVKDMDEMFGSLRINATQVSTNLLFGDNNIEVEVKYPVEISIGKRNSRIVMNTFSLTLPIRFKQIWKHLNRVIYEDSIKFSYNKSYEARGTMWDVNFINSFDTIGFDEVYTLIDTKSNIDDNPYQFNILIQNRRPALEYLNFGSMIRSDLSCFDIVTWPGETIYIPTKGYDPDEDSLNYYYSGWQEDYSSEFNNTCYSSKTIDCNGDISYFDSCEKKINPAPGLWMSSTPYNSDKKSAEYTVQDLDIGIHHVLVKVEDGELADWQNLSILVLDTPTISATLKNPYDDISNNYTSIEDLTSIDASASSSLVSLQDITYSEITPGYEWSFTLPAAITIYLPRNSPSDNTDYLPEDIKNLLQYQFSETGFHTIEIIASNGISAGKSEIAIEVLACLPHESTIPSYPYNIWLDTAADPYQGDHACCVASDPTNLSTSSIVTDTTTQCYSFTKYGYHGLFNEAYMKKVYNEVKLTQPTKYNSIIKNPPVTLITSSGLGFDINSNEANDIYKRSFIRNCDGTRGNICNGTITDTIERVSDCDNNQFGTENKRCSGPSLSLMKNLVGSLPACTKYLGTTFEKTVAVSLDPSLPNIDACDERPKCSDGTTYGVGGPNSRWLTNATCNGAGSCNKIYETDKLDCYSFNTCSDSENPGVINSKDASVPGTITGIQFASCSNTLNGCSSNSIPSSVKDTCIDSTNLNETFCTVSSGGNNPKPYSFTTIDCTIVYKAECIEISPGSKTYKERVSGSCNSGACIPASYSGCNEYACVNGGVNGDTCAPSCDNNNKCSLDYHCFNDDNKCYPDTNTNTCDEPNDCTASLPKCDIPTSKCCVSDVGDSCSGSNDCNNYQISCSGTCNYISAKSSGTPCNSGGTCNGAGSCVLPSPSQT